VLRTLQGQRQDPFLQLRVDFGWVHLEGKPEGPNKATSTPLSAVVGSVLAGLILALSTKRYRVPMYRNFQIVGSHPRQSAIITIPS
jgi:hypothetical protein